MLVVVGALVTANLRRRQLRAGEQRLARQSDALTDMTGRQAAVEVGYDERLRQILATCADTLAAERASLWQFTPDRDAILCASLFEREGRRHGSGDRLERAKFPAYFAALDPPRSAGGSA